MVFQLTANGSEITLTRTRTRVPWVPSQVKIRRHEEPYLCHVLLEDSWPAGTYEVAELLDECHVPLDASVRVAITALERQAKVAGPSS